MSRQPTADAAAPTAAEPAVQVESYSYTFASADKPAIDQVCFTLPSHGWTLLAGATGSGKSTLLRAISGTLPTGGWAAGLIRVAGERRVGLMLQSADDQLCTTTPLAELAFGLENLALTSDAIAARLAEVIERFELQRICRQSVARLSGGEKQRLLLAAIMAMRPNVLLLDEPLAQLDPESAGQLLDQLAALRDTGTTILVAEHRLDELLPRVDRVMAMRGGRLIGSSDTSQGEVVGALLTEAGLRWPDVARLSWRVRGAWSLDAASLDMARLEAERGEQVAAARGEQDAAHDRQGANAARPLVLQAERLGFGFSPAGNLFWSELSAELRRGEVVALVGPNGSGKSTLLATLAGELQPSRGTLRRGTLCRGDNSRASGTRPAIALSPQNPDLALFCSRVCDELAFGPRCFLEARRALAQENEQTVEQIVEQTLRQLDLVALAERNPQSLSRGERLRVVVGAMLAMRPELLLLDEPTTGQDPHQAETVLRAIGQAVGSGEVGAAIFSTHDLRAAVRHADRIWLLADGALQVDCLADDLLEHVEAFDQARLRPGELQRLTQATDLSPRVLQRWLAEEERP